MLPVFEVLSRGQSDDVSAVGPSDVPGLPEAPAVFFFFALFFSFFAVVLVWQWSSSLTAGFGDMQKASPAEVVQRMEAICDN